MGRAGSSLIGYKKDRWAEGWIKRMEDVLVGSYDLRCELYTNSISETQSVEIHVGLDCRSRQNIWRHKYYYYVFWVCKRRLSHGASILTPGTFRCHNA